MFNVFEFWYPYYRLKEEGVEVTVVGSGSAEVYTGKPCTQAKADTSAGNVYAKTLTGL
jgi:protease I